MPEKTKPVTIKSTKQEMLDAYNDLVQKLEQKREEELKPEKKAEEKKIQKVIENTDKLTLDKIAQETGKLKSEISRTISDLVEKLEAELVKYDEMKTAVATKEKELSEIYEIQKSASSLAALIEAQNQRRKDFELEMEEKKGKLVLEIEETRKKWEQEKFEYETQLKERKEQEEKLRKREKEEYEYNFKREQLLSKNRFEDDKNQAEKELKEKIAQAENDLSEREQRIAEREQRINDLEKQIADLETNEREVIAKAIKDASDKLKLDYESKEKLFNKEFEGERNVLNTRIQSLEEIVSKQNQQIAALTQQIEKASVKVQDIAVKAIEGSSHSKLFNEIQSMIEEKKHTENQIKVKTEK